jgi:hypothetical protein
MAAQLCLVWEAVVVYENLWHEVLGMGFDDNIIM